MMRDQVLCTLGDPTEIADTELIRIGQRGREHQASGVRESLGPAGCLFRLLNGKALPSQGLGFGEVQAEEVTVIVSHRFDKLTHVGILVGSALEVDEPAPEVTSQT